ncbi:sterigmatocystin 8-O-methyltransferase [Xylariaceae sp. FL1019]|nr:sterigmatocystin 8-O-methyltransferase [Xylariaceae sp. FL1019]
MATFDSEIPIALIEQLKDLTAQLSSQDANTRKQALLLSKKLTTSLEQPETAAVELSFSGVIPVAARIGVELGLFKHISEHDGPIDAAELAKMTGGEELLIMRILRAMSSIGFVREVDEMKWEANAVTRAMATDGIAAGHRMLGDTTVLRAAVAAPKYFKEAGYTCPTDPKDGLMQYAFQSKLSSFDLLASMPDVLHDFNTFMGNTMGAREYWTDWYPVQEQLLDGASSDSVLLVDVGGGKGHDIAAFHNKYPGKGRLVLEDLGAVTNNIGATLDPAIEVLQYDFFTEQPIEGARAYFFHHILHDWSDDVCLDILKHVTKAMKPGYSKLLLHEMIIPAQNASSFHAMLDLSMMAFNGGMERTERQWGALLAKAGLDVIKVWPPMQDDADGIVEAVLKA